MGFTLRSIPEVKELITKSMTLASTVMDKEEVFKRAMLSFDSTCTSFTPTPAFINGNLRNHHIF